MFMEDDDDPNMEMEEEYDPAMDMEDMIQSLDHIRLPYPWQESRPGVKCCTHLSTCTTSC